jgi:hypothetical protein
VVTANRLCENCDERRMRNGPGAFLRTNKPQVTLVPLNVHRVPDEARDIGKRVAQDLRHLICQAECISVDKCNVNRLVHFGSTISNCKDVFLHQISRSRTLVGRDTTL